MTLNWGKGIVFVYSIFALSMLGLAYQSTKHDVGLVKKDYYDDEINYQTHYVKMQNARQLTTDLKIAFDSTGRDILLTFPTHLPKPSGKVLLFRPSQTGVDATLDIVTDAQYSMIISTKSLLSGLWKIKVDWQANGKDYYKEQPLTIGK